MSSLSAVQNSATTVIAPVRTDTATERRILSNDRPPSDLKLATGAGSSLSSVSSSQINVASTASKTAIFPGPRVIIDPAYNKAIFQVLNPDTGAVQQQFPTQEAVRRYERTAHSVPEAPAPEASGNPIKG